MKIKKFSKKPTDVESRVGADPVVCYPNDNINNNHGDDVEHDDFFFAMAC